MAGNGQTQRTGTVIRRTRAQHRDIGWVGNQTGAYGDIIGPSVPVGYSIPVAVAAQAIIPAPSISTSPTNVTISAIAVAAYALVQYVTPSFPQEQVIQPNQPVLSAKPRGAFYNGAYNEIPFQTVPVGVPAGATRTPIDPSNVEPVVNNHG